MKKGLSRATAFCLAAGITLSLSGNGFAYAAGHLTLVGIGAEKVSAPAETQTEAQTSAPQTEAPQTEAPQTEAPQTEAPQTEAPQTEAPQTEGVDKSMVGTMGFTRSAGTVNVRASGDTEGEVIGSLDNLDSVEIEDVDENGWYKIKSGSLEGYVAGQYIATGSEASQISENAGYTSAYVGAEVLNVRADKSNDAEVVATASEGDNLEVVEDDGDWLKVVTADGTYGYVSGDYVDAKTEYSTGSTVQEQEESEKAAEEAAAQAAEEAEAAAAQQTVSSDEDTAAPVQESVSSDSQSAAVSSGNSNVDALYQAYLDAQDAAMHPVDEADAEAKADAAVDAYNAYVAAANGSGTVAAADTGASVSSSASGETVSSDQTSGSSDLNALYQAYLAAQDAAMSPVDEADAKAKADACIAAYNAYVAASQAAGSTASVTAPAETASADTTAQTEAPQTEAPQTEAPQTEAQTTAQTEAQTSSIGSQIAAYAQQFVGNPYVYGGASLTGGADCSGFTMAVFANFGIGLPHNAAAQSGMGTEVSMSDLQPGDLLFYSNGSGIGHVTIYIGNGQVCHASNERVGITISSIGYRTPVSARRMW